MSEEPKRDGNFDDFADEYDEEAAHLKLNQDVADLITNRGATKDQTLLEFGCGTGNLCLKLSEQLGHIYGVDISKNMLEKAKVKIEEKGIKNVTVKQLELNEQKQLPEIGFPDQYDWLLVGMVLHHLPDPMAKLELFKQLVKPSGTLVIVEFGEKEGDGHGHSHGHGHGHDDHHGHGHSHGEGASKLSEADKDKFGIFTDGFNPTKLQEALEKLGFSKIELNTGLKMEMVEKPEHPFHGYPIVVILASPA
eukprot:Clim_evm33s148 gene=Clim_evmTU33s148